MPMRVLPKFVKNVGRSLGRSTASAFGDMMPSMKNSGIDSKNYIAEVYNSSREKVTPNEVKQTYIYKSGQQLINNAIRDLKSGNFYNKERQQQASNDSFKEMFGIDLDNLTNFEDQNKETTKEKDGKTIHNTSNNTQQNVFVNNSDPSTSKSIQQLTTISSSAMKMSHYNSSALSKQISTLIEFQHNNTNRFYTEMSSKMADITRDVSQMTGFLGVMAEVSVGGTRRTQGESMLATLLGLEGFSVSGMKDMYRKKYSNSTGGMKDTFNLVIKPYIDEVVANPIGALTKNAIKLALPRALKSAVGDMDQMFKFLPTMIQGKAKDWEGSDNIFKRNAAKIFGIDLKEDKGFNFSNYEKGKVAFDGVTRRSIVNVIPSLLSKILASVSNNSTHKEELIYDYDKGKFTTRKRVIKEMNSDIKNFTIDNYDLTNYKEQIARENQSKFSSSEELSAFMERVDKALLSMVKNSKMIHGNSKASDISEDEDVANAILNNFKGQTNANKSKYQYDLLSASKAYSDIYRRIEQNESFNNAFDMTKEERIFEPETNKEMARRVKSNIDRFFGVGQGPVENNMSKKNPLYWLTEGIKRVNGKTSEFFYGQDNNEYAYTRPQQPSSNQQNTVNRGSKIRDFASRVVNTGSNAISRLNTRNGLVSERRTSPSIPVISNTEDTSSNNTTRELSNLNQNIEEVNNEISGDRGITRSIFLLNRNIERNNRIMEGRNDEKTSSSTNSTAIRTTNVQNPDLSILPKINDNILHIIALLEAKFSGDGLPVGRIGKFKNVIGSYKDKTLNFFEKLFGRGRSNSGGFFSRTAEKVKGFIGMVFGNSGSRTSLLSKLFGGAMDSIRGANGRQSITSRLLGRDGIITKFVSGTLTTVLDVASKTIPKATKFAGEVTKGFLNFGKSAFSLILGAGKKGLDKAKELRSNRSASRAGRSGNRNIKGMRGLLGLLTSTTGSVIGGAGSLIGGSLSLGMRGVSKVGDIASGIGNKLSGRKGHKKSKSSSNRRSFSMPDILDRVFNRKSDSLHVFVDGGSLDKIREVVKVQTHISDGNSAVEQIAEFKKRRQNNENSLLQNLKGGRKKRNRNNLTGEQSSGGGFLSGTLSNIAGDIIGEVIGNKIAGRGGRDTGTRAGRRAGRRGIFGRIGSLFNRNRGASEAIEGATDLAQNSTRMGRNQATGRGIRGMFSRIGGGLSRLGGRGMAGISALGAGAGLASGGAGVAQAATTGASATQAATTAAGASGVAGAASGGAKGLLRGAGTALRGAGRLAKFIPGVGLVATAGMGVMDAINGVQNANQIFGTEKATLGQKVSAGAGSVISGLTFGLADKEKVSKGIYGFGNKIKDFGSKALSTVKKNPLLLAGGIGGGLGLGALGLSKMFGKKEDEDQKRDAEKGENSKQPINKISAWVEKLGKFFSIGAGGTFFSGIWGMITGKTGGIFDKIGNWFKGLFGGGKDDSNSGGDSYTGKIGSGIGALAAKYESSGNAGTVANSSGDIGGQSFGKYQLARNTGSYKSFINKLSDYGHEDWEKQLKSAYNSTSQSAAVWKKIYKENPKEFEKVQDQYFADQYFRPAAGKIKSAIGLDVGKRSTAVQAVLLSTAVQHGTAGAVNVWKNALGSKANDMSDSEIINAVYKERAANNGMKYFPSSSAAIRKGVVNRFSREKKDALAMLAKDGGEKANTSSDSDKDTKDSSSTGSTASKVMNDRSQFYDNPFDSASSGGGYTNSTAGYDSAPSSSYKSIGGFSLGSSAGKALTSGSAYVANLLSTSDKAMGDLRWSIGNNTISKANSIKNSYLNSNSSSNPFSALGIGTGTTSNIKSTASSSLVSPLSSIPKLSSSSSESNTGSTITGNDFTEMLKNSDEIAQMQSILKQINENSKQGNSILAKMLEAIIDIRDNKSFGGTTVVNNTSSGSNYSSSSISPETDSMLKGY